MKKVAIIDIGSNSVRLVLFEVYKNHSFRVIDDIKESPRLGEGIFENGLMKEKNMNKAIEALKLFRSLCDFQKVQDILVFGTAAMRIAKNANEFIKKVNEECQFPIQILSGEEEAKYSFFGAINSLDISEGLLVDMGGASCELVYFKNREIEESISLNFGSLSIMETFQVKDFMTKEKEELINEFLIKEFEKIPWLKKVEGLYLIGVGGTIRNLGKINMEKIEYPIQNLHNYVLSYFDLKDIYNELKSKDFKEKQKIKGLAKSRADIISGASFVFYKLVEFTGLKGVKISGKGIREGFLYDYLSNHGKKIENVFNYGLFNVCERYKLSKEYGEDIFKTFCDLFERLKFIHNLEINDKIAKTICYLVSSGVNISYYDNDIHSFYMILNSRLDGISHKHLLMSALISSQQNKRNSYYEKYLSLLEEKDIYVINIYGLILSFSKTFNRLHSKEVSEFIVSEEENSIKIDIKSSECLALEIKIAMESSKRFEKLLNRKILITQK
ncbi:MAG: exopolyphosphatase [Fusobacteriaceae bacterium]|nr:exopolyphosphatase [Fusobacteriaceae bacterium]